VRRYATRSLPIASVQFEYAAWLPLRVFEQLARYVLAREAELLLQHNEIPESLNDLLANVVRRFNILRVKVRQTEGGERGVMHEAVEQLQPVK